MNGKVIGIQGTLGSGKTSKAVEMGIDLLWRGGWVFTNIELYPDKIRQRFAEDGREFDPSRLVLLGNDTKDYHFKVKRGTADMQVLVIIDEASLQHNAHDFKTVDRDLLNFVILCRKLDIDLVYACPDLQNVDKQIRGHIQHMWNCRNMKELKILGVIPFPLPFYIRVPYTKIGGKMMRLSSAEYIFRSPVWGLFNSDALLGDAAAKFAKLEVATASPLKRCAPVKRAARVGESLWQYVAYGIATFAAVFLCRTYGFF